MSLARTFPRREIAPRPIPKAREARGQALTPGAFLATLSIGMFVMASWAAPEEPSTPVESTFTGTWTATVGKSRTLHGRWVGQAIPGDPHSAHGSWTLTGRQGKSVLTGTWSARKTAQGWRGNWSAQASTGPTTGGTWRADLPADPESTLQDFLEKLSQEEIAGTWGSARLAGSWLLTGKARSAPRRSAD